MIMILFLFLFLGLDGSLPGVTGSRRFSGKQKPGGMAMKSLIQIVCKILATE